LANSGEAEELAVVARPRARTSIATSHFARSLFNLIRPDHRRESNVAAGHLDLVVPFLNSSRLRYNDREVGVLKFHAMEGV
jgi:hypothetical protein